LSKIDRFVFRLSRFGPQSRANGHSACACWEIT